MTAIALLPGALAAAGRAQVAPGLAGPGAAGTISLVAGGGSGGVKATRLAMDPADVTFGAGTLYISGTTVRAVNPVTDWATTVAGNGSRVPPGDGGQARQAGLDANASALDHAGNLVIADGLNRIRVVARSTGTFYGQPMTAGRIYTIAGRGGADGFSGDGVPAVGARLAFPTAIAVDGTGNVIIADAINNRMRVVAASTGTFYGQAMTAGDIYTVAGDGTRGFSGDGGPAARAALAFPDGVALDGAGNLVIADSANNRIRVVAASTGTFYGQAMTAGDIYTIAGDGAWSYSGDGGPAASAALADPEGVAVDAAGNVLLADSENSRIRVVAASTGTFYGQAMTAGDIYTVAGGGQSGSLGTGGPATKARLAAPSGVALDGAGNLVIADGTFAVRVVAASTGTFYRQAMTAGDIYTIAGRPDFGGLVRGLTCCPGAPATTNQLPFLRSVTTDQAGSLLIAEASEVEVDPAASGTFYGRPMAAGHIYVIAGNGTRGYAGDGGPAARAELSKPDGVVVDGSGNVIIADAGNQRIRVVAATTGTFYGQQMTAGDIYTIAGSGGTGLSGNGGPATSATLGFPGKPAVDSAGNLLIADTFNQEIRVVAATTGTFYGQAMTAGDIYDIAGDGQWSGDRTGVPATSSALGVPAGVTVDGAGNVVIADTDNSDIDVVAVSTGTFYGQPMTAGDIYRVAGGTPGYSGDGGPAVKARMWFTSAVSVDGSGNLIIADQANARIRVVAATAGTFYGQQMTAGDIYTIAGNGKTVIGGGDRAAATVGLATDVRLHQVNDVTVTAAGGILIADDASVGGDLTFEPYSRVQLIHG